MSVFYRKNQRLLSKSDFKNLFSGSTKHREKSFSIISKSNSTEQSRLGISISRKICNAVNRNRLKRITREAFRTCPTLEGNDLLVIIHRPITNEKFFLQSLTPYFT